MFKGLRLSRPDSPVGQAALPGHWPASVDAPVTLSIRSPTSNFKCQAFSTLVRVAAGPHRGLLRAPAVAHHDPQTDPCGRWEHLSRRGRVARRQNPETHRVHLPPHRVLADFRTSCSPRRCSLDGGRSRRFRGLPAKRLFRLRRFGFRLDFALALELLPLQFLDLRLSKSFVAPKPSQSGRMLTENY